MKKKIIVIGGSGFIGTHLIKKLNSMFNLLNIDKEKSKLNVHQKIGDIRNIEFLDNSLESSSIIIHLAAEHKDNVHPSKLYYDVNCDGTKNIVNIAKKKGIKKIIFLSTVAVYGESDKNNFVNEKNITNPNNHYGKSKLQAEQILIEWVKENNDNELAIIRPTAVFGIGCKGNIFNLAKHIHAKKPLIKSNTKKSIISVNELLECIIQNIYKPIKLEVINAIGKKDLEVNEICNIFSRDFHGKNFELYLPYNLSFKILNLINYFHQKFFKTEFLYRKRAKKFVTETIFESNFYKNIYDNEEELKRYSEFLSKNINKKSI